MLPRKAMRLGFGLSAVVGAFALGDIDRVLAQAPTFTAPSVAPSIGPSATYSTAAPSSPYAAPAGAYTSPALPSYPIQTGGYPSVSPTVVFSDDLDIPFSQTGIFSSTPGEDGAGHGVGFMAEDEVETVVINDPEKLPAPLLEQLKMLPEKEREKLFAAVKKSGVKVPKSFLEQATPLRPDDPAAMHAARMLMQFSEVKQWPRAASDVLTARSERLLRGDAKIDPLAGDGKTPLALGDLFASRAGGEGLSDLQNRAVAGDWPAVKKQLGSLPPQVAEGVYARMLQLLVQNQTAPAPLEILALADAAPQKLRRSQIAMLGAMLERSLKSVDTPAKFLAALEKGNDRVGGKGSAERLAAARLLAEVKLVYEAQKYLLPAAEAKKLNDAEQLNLRSTLRLQFEESTGGAGFHESWALFQHVLKTAEPTSLGYREALHYTISLLPKVGRELSGPWLRETFEKNPVLGLRLLAAITQRLDAGGGQESSGGPSNGSNGDPFADLKALKQAMQELAPTVKAKPDVWLPTVQLVATRWCDQLDKLVDGNDSVPADEIDQEMLEQMQRSHSISTSYTINGMTVNAGAAYGMPNAVSRSFSRVSHTSHSRGNNTPRSPRFFAQLLVASPDEICLASVEPEIAWRARKIAGHVAVKAGDKAATFASIKTLLPHDAETAEALAAEYVMEWGSRRTEGEQDEDLANMSMRVPSMHGHSYGGNYSNGMESGAIPLTRAQQVRKLKDLRKVLDELAALGVKRPRQSIVVSVFSACHSQAEIYLREDIAAVFGDPTKLDVEAVEALVEAMRNKLAGEWRKPDLQAAQATNRTDAELVAEINRGYGLALEMLDGAIKPAAPNPILPRLLVLRGNIHFDHAEFMYGQKVDLKTYVTARDQAFANYRQAHEAYAAGLKADTVKNDPKKDDAAKSDPANEAAATALNENWYENQGSSIYGQWFQSALGTSDLAYLTRQDEPDRDQIDQLTAAIKSLGPKAAEAMLKEFGEGMSGAVSQVPPHLKPHYMREALRVVGDHPSGKPLKRLVDFYAELTREIELHVRVDGSGDVGQEPFGALIVVRGTNAVMRESSAFAMLMQQQNYGYPGGQGGGGIKETLEKELREKLGKGFEVMQVRFNEASLEPRTFGRDGWRELPLAYALLRVKDAAVDKIPSIEIDMTFADGQGPVVLPISSPVLLIDARSAAEPRPLVELKIKQTFDDRKIDKGSVRLEIAASGKGLIPKLDDVLQLPNKAGLPVADSEFKVADLIDHGITIGSLDATAGDLRPDCERRWTLELAPQAERAPTEFRFPAAIAPATMELARYDDADLAEAEPVTAVRGSMMSSGRWLWIVGASIGLLAVIAIGIVVARRRRSRRHAPAESRFVRPDEVTPFSVIAVLKRIVAEPPPKFTSIDQAELSGAIKTFEDRYFARAEPATRGHENGHAELESLLNTWLTKAAGPSARRN